jgi:hypothetical protein
LSDHISGPRALAEPIADITDVYAFPSPERPGHLVLVVNTLPFAPPDARLSDGLIYRFRVRPLVERERSEYRAPFGLADDELVFDCVFSEPDGSIQEGSVTTPAGDVVSFAVDDEGGGEANGVRAFAGPRWDPFFFDAPAALKTIETEKLEFTDSGSIFLDGKNVLTFVAEVDCSRFFDGAGLVGIVAETLTRGRHNVRLERVGRPEVKNMLLAPKQFDQLNRDVELRDIYNMEDGFHLAATYLAAYRARLNANLAFWDGLDGKQRWQPDEDGKHPLTDLFLADFLIVDLDKPYQERGSYLEIELARRAGRDHETCGGRALNDDVMDTFFTLIVNGGDGPVIRDGVEGATRPGTSTFPYLAPPNPDPPSPPEHFSRGHE